MDDVTQILGDTESKGGSTSTIQNPPKAMKITGMSKEVETDTNLNESVQL